MTQQFDSNVDNLAKYGPTFQTKVLTCMLSSVEFLQQSLDVLNPNFFENEAGKWIVDQTVDYYTHYKAIPTLDVFKVELDKVNDDVLKVAVKEQLRGAMQKRNDDDLKYIQDSFLDFAKNQSLKSAILKSVDFLQAGRYSDIKGLIDAAMKAGQPRNIGHDWKKDVDIRLSGKARRTVATGWEVIDLLTGGGLAGGELGVIAAPSGIGKSWALATIGANAAREGKRVVYYTMELNENYVGLRYDTIFTGIESGEIVNNPTMVQGAIGSIAGEIIIKYYPPGCITVHTIRAHLENLIANKMKPDIILIDYGDLMIAADRQNSKHEELGQIYKELRGLSGELDIPCWTASQTQRSSIQDEIIQADKIASSYEKIMNADLVISLSRKLEDKANHTGRAHVMKNRFGADGLTFPAYMNTTMGQIQIYDEQSSKGILLKKQMAAGATMIKQSLQKKFMELQNELLEE